MSYSFAEVREDVRDLEAQVAALETKVYGRWERITSNQAIAAAGNANVIANSEVYRSDPNNDLSYSTSSGVMTINAAGLYMFSVGARLSSSTTGNVIIVIDTSNNGNAAANANSQSATNTWRIGVSTVVWLAVGETIHGNVWTTAARNILVGGDSHVAIVRL